MPLDDRGLLLADGLFETLLLEQGQPQLLEAHLNRWTNSAALLGLPPPPGQDHLRPLIAEAIQRSGIHTGALRLNWSRGSSGRGLDLPEPDQVVSDPRFWLQLTAMRPCFDPLRVMISATEQRLAGSVLSRCKTFAYGSAIQARREARQRGADDALLLSSAGGLCCGTSANLLVRRRGLWLTPPLASGCLPGILRAQALALGLAREAPLHWQELRGWWEGGDGACLLINSLSCRPIQTLEGAALPVVAAEPLWRHLMAEAP
ncbi:MAG: aminotransferase class IV [Cyanobacteriota bacterium]